MRRFVTLLAAALVLSACAKEAPEETAPQPIFDIDRERVSVSGLSAGAYMAGQLHVAHSDLFSGAGLLAGGPYWCAQGSIKRGLGPCMKGGDIGVDALVAFARESAANGAIDPLDNLDGDPVWSFHGSKDPAIHADVPAAAITFYEAFVGEGTITSAVNAAAAHGFPTISTGATCDQMVTPFLNACGYDAAGELLQALYGELAERVEAAGELQPVPQPGADDATMLADAFLYVPASCASGERCGLHVALHGCQQSSEHVGDAFAAGAGYNEWAESNKLLVLYPQVASSRIAPLNPLGCWDWWGYTGEAYATKAGPQISVIKATIDSIAGWTQ